MIGLPRTLIKLEAMKYKQGDKLEKMNQISRDKSDSRCVDSVNNPLLWELFDLTLRMRSFHVMIGGFSSRAVIHVVIPPGPLSFLTARLSR